MKILPNFAKQLTSHAGDSPAKTQASLIQKVKDWTGKGRDFGENILDLYANYSLNTQSWKMCPGFIPEDFIELSKTWPRAGMMRNGNVYRQPQLVPPTYGKGCGLLPTPAASQNYKPIRCLAPSEAEGNHGTMLVAAIGNLYPELIGGYIHIQFLLWMMGYPTDWLESQSEILLFPM